MDQAMPLPAGLGRSGTEALQELEQQLRQVEQIRLKGLAPHESTCPHTGDDLSFDRYGNDLNSPLAWAIDKSKRRIKVSCN